MQTAIDKWMGYASPLTKGRFDFTLGDASPRWNTLFNCMSMTLGRWWTRILGGTNLRRAAGETIPTTADPICGRCDGPSTAIHDCAAIFGHPVDSRWVYGVCCVGAGGVEEKYIASIREVVFDGAGAWAGLVPNPAMGISAKANNDGSFTLVFRYDHKGQQAAPSVFNIYSSVKNGGAIDYGSIIGTVAYEVGRTEYSFTTSILSDATPGLYHFAIRAMALSGAEEKNELTAAARNTTTAPYGTVKVYGGPRGPVASAGSLSD